MIDTDLALQLLVQEVLHSTDFVLKADGYSHLAAGSDVGAAVVHLLRVKQLYAFSGRTQLLDAHLGLDTEDVLNE